MFRLLRLFVADMRILPWQVKTASFSASLFFLGWGFYDSYLSIVAHDILGHNLASVGYLNGAFMLLGLLMALPATQLDEHFSFRFTLLASKLFYVIALLSYFFATIWTSVFFLWLGFIINGTANPFVHNTYESVVRQFSTKRIASRVFGLYSFLTGLTWTLGLFIAAIVVIPYFGTQWLSLIVIGFVVLSFLPDVGFPKQKVSWRKGLVAFLDVNKTWKKMYHHITHYDSKTYFTLTAWFFWSLLEFMTFIYVPLFALTLDLNLTEIGLLMIVVRSPYLFSFVFSEFADRKDRFLLLAFSFFLVSGLLMLLVYAERVVPVLIIVTLITSCLAFMRPTISGILTTLVVPNRRVEVTGMQTLFSKGGAIVGSVLFGSLAQQIGFHITYGMFAVMTICIAAGCMWVRAHFAEHNVLHHFRGRVLHRHRSAASPAHL